MKKAWPVLLVLWPYAGLGLLWWTLSQEHLTGIPLLIWLAALLVICAANAVCALRRESDAGKVGCLLKEALIPFYGCVFFLGMMMVAAPLGLIILFLLDGILLLSTSAYTLRSIFLAWRAGQMSSVLATVLAVSQLIFVLDVVGSVILELQEKQRSH